MIPGLTTKISEELISLTSTISPSSDLLHVTSTASTTVLKTINPPFGGSPGIQVILNRSGNNITTITTGNIATATTVGQNVAIVLVYSVLTGKYYVGALA